MIRPICALVIGHSETSKGAENIMHDCAEFDFNDKLAQAVKNRFEMHKKGERFVELVYRKSYRELPDQIDKLNPFFAVSLHSNAYNGKATGTETLYWHKSETGKKIAELFQDFMCVKLKLKDRGIKPKTMEDRGGYVLGNVKCPMVILEPFFIDNDYDFEHVSKWFDRLVDAIYYGITNAYYDFFWDRGRIENEN